MDGKQEVVVDEKKEFKSVTDEIILKVLKQPDDLIPALDELVAVYGRDAIHEWRLDNKHKHALVHELVRRRKSEALGHIVSTHKFDINVPRSSDQCTPLHLALWTKQPDLMKLLLDLGADPTLKNKYGEDSSKLLEITKKMENMAWLDLELTHLPKDGNCEDSILECALVITTKHFEELARKTWVVGHPKEKLDALSAWHLKTFANVEAGGNGLLDAVVVSETSKAQMEEELLDILKEHCVEGLCKLAGNSVHCDREVLLQALPDVYKFCSHQVIDVSTVSNLVQFWNPALAAERPSAKLYNHRAENDIDSSIAMLKWYQEQVFLPKQRE